MKPKVAIITRAFNRLELTIRCINGVRMWAGYDNYEHVIVTQNSTDGTKEWLAWMQKNSPKYMKHVRVINNEGNSGDWKGFVHEVWFIIL